jgi:hypothetical protein
MSGDDLTIRGIWFCIAIAFMLAGVTVAGWNSRLLIGGLFVMALVTMGLAIFWPWVGGHWPKFKQLMAQIVSNDYAFGAVAVVVLLIFFADFALRVGWISRPSTDQTGSLTPVYNQIYDGQVIELDGKAFHNCTFNNVTFRWKGGPYLMDTVQITGSRRFETPVGVIGNTVITLKALKLLNQEFADNWRSLPSEYFNPPQGGN